MKKNNAINFIGKLVKVVIDRPLGSKHPQYQTVYPINYGYIPGVMAPDNAELDAFILGVDAPVKEFTGTCIAVIHRTNDNEDKLIVAPKGHEFSDAEIKKITRFQEKYFESIILRQ